VRVDAEHAEIALAELLELAPTGVEQVELDDGSVEYAVYGAPGELPSLPALTAAAGEALVEITTQEVPEGWEERWRQFHRPLVLGSRLTVRPPWEPRGGTDLDVVIDPGRAFGTGAHATTRLCLELLLELGASGPFVDLGCGSGVLAIVAARLGFAPVTALDNDPAAIEATLQNADANGVALAEVRRFDLRGELPELGGATVAANLVAPLLRTLAERLAEAGQLPARLIASGLLVGEADVAAAAFAAGGLREAARRERGEWSALLLRTPVYPSGDGPEQSPLAG
jgi:ribosomal protein L11 methyltransferase